MPVRSYGHNYLDKTTSLQISLSDGISSTQRSPIEWYLDESLFSSSKLTVSLKSTKRKHVSELIPYTVSLPIVDCSESFTFQVDSLDNLCVEFEIYPTFGSKAIAKGVAGPKLFDDVCTRTHQGIFTVPLLDPRLQSIGHLSFEFTVIKPFIGVQFDIHSRIETYWKSTQTITGTKIRAQSQHLQHLVTESSLSGQYVWIPVQITKDNVAYVCPTWQLPTALLELLPNQVKAIELEHICASVRSRELVLSALKNVKTTNDVQRIVGNSYLPLAEFLSNLDSAYKLHLQILLPTLAEQRFLGVDISTNVNTIIDTILSTVFAEADALKKSVESINPSETRSIFFSSSHPTLCTALNWKQPNCKFAVR